MAKVEVSDHMSRFEEVAMKGLEHIETYLGYEGTDPVYHQKAKIGAVPVNAFTRMFAAMNNRMALQAAQERRAIGDGSKAP